MISFGRLQTRSRYMGDTRFCSRGQSCLRGRGEVEETGPKGPFSGGGARPLQWHPRAQKARHHNREQEDSAKTRAPRRRPRRPRREAFQRAAASVAHPLSADRRFWARGSRCRRHLSLESPRSLLLGTLGVGAFGRAPTPDTVVNLVLYVRLAPPAARARPERGRHPGKRQAPNGAHGEQCLLRKRDNKKIPERRKEKKNEKMSKKRGKWENRVKE